MSEPYSHFEKAASVASEAAFSALQEVERLQAELDALREQLTWSNRLGQLGTLAAALAHEYNNILTPIGSYAQLAQAHPDRPELTRRALAAAAAGSAKARRLVEGVMGLALPGASQGDRVCVAGEVVEAAAECMSPLLEQHKIKIRTRIEQAEVAMDGLALEQVLVNLIGNACQAMSGVAGRRTLSIESERRGAGLVIRVADSGPGVPDALHGRLFEPFVTQQACGGEGLSKSARGSGLGLHISRCLVEAAGGEITLAQSEAGGATFEVSLPLA